MENLCHTLAGAALGEAGLKKQTTLGMATLMIASNLPDVDVGVFATNTLAMSFRRGWTHGVLAMVVLPAVFAGLMMAWDRWRPRRSSLRLPANLAGLLLLAYLGTWLHVFMDFLNSYGVRLLMPFSDRWFYGDALYIVDPLLDVLLGGAIIAARVRAKRHIESAHRPARIWLALAGVYVALMLGSNVWARSAVASGLQRAGRPSETRFMVTPVFGNPVRREVIVDTIDRYEKGFLWFDPLPHFRPAGYGVDTNLTDPDAQEAARTPRIQAYLRWSRFPFFVIAHQANGTRVYLNDYRYSGPSARDGWAATEVHLSH
jgi:inner membrane protein